MKGIVRYVGMDVHAEVAVVEADGTERDLGVIPKCRISFTWHRTGRGKGPSR